MSMLESNGLKGQGLFLVNTPLLVAPYNACLEDMDIAPTSLKEFRIDATGWSPDIADEKGDHKYLSHSAANMLMIILSPEQRQCSIWNPFHSFDWDLLKQFFDNNRQQIAELTQRDAIWLDIDQEVDVYHEPNDLLLVDSITVRAYTPTRLMVEARTQRQLIHDITHECDSFEAEAEALLVLPGKLQSSVENVGDVAHRSMVIQDMPFTVPRNFYTHAFEGTFVLRHPSGNDEQLLAKAVAASSRGVQSNTDKKIIKRLESLGLISYSPQRWLESLSHLRIIRDSFLMDVLDKQEPELNFVALSEVRQKAVLNRAKVAKALPEEYRLLDRLILRLERGEVPKRVSAKIRPYLAHPCQELDKPTKEVIWYVLSLIFDGRSVVRQYRYDKAAFYDLHENKWQTPWRTFAEECIEKYRVRRMRPAS